MRTNGGIDSTVRKSLRGSNTGTGCCRRAEEIMSESESGEEEDVLPGGRSVGARSKIVWMSSDCSSCWTLIGIIAGWMALADRT